MKSYIKFETHEERYSNKMVERKQDDQEVPEHARLALFVDFRAFLSNFKFRSSE